VIRTMVGEMEIAPGDQAKAFSVMPFVSNIGSILGPVVGGLYLPSILFLDLNGDTNYSLQVSGSS